MNIVFGVHSGIEGRVSRVTFRSVPFCWHFVGRRSIWRFFGNRYTCEGTLPLPMILTIRHVSYTYRLLLHTIFLRDYNDFPLSVEANKILLHDNVITTHHFIHYNFIPVAYFPCMLCPVCMYYYIVMIEQIFLFSIRTFGHKIHIMHVATPPFVDDMPVESLSSAASCMRCHNIKSKKKKNVFIFGYFIYVDVPYIPKPICIYIFSLDFLF